MTHGASATTLFNIYRTWILPIIEYGSISWIFQAFPDVGLDRPAAYGYGGSMRELESFHTRMIKACLGLKTCSSSLSAHVIMGTMPIRYHLAYKAAVWYYKIHHGDAGAVLRNQMMQLKAEPEKWKRTIFYWPCEKFISVMGKVIDSDLLHEDTKERFKSKLRDAIYRNLTGKWQGLTDRSVTTRTFLPSWKKRKLSHRNLSRKAETTYFQLLSGKDDFQQQWINNNRWKCRHCESEGNGILFKHKLFVCQRLRTQQQTLRQQFRLSHIQFSEVGIADPRVAHSVQRFIQTSDHTGYL